MNNIYKLKAKGLRLKAISYSIFKIQYLKKERTVFSFLKIPCTLLLVSLILANANAQKSSMRADTLYATNPTSTNKGIIISDTLKLLNFDNTKSSGSSGDSILTINDKGYVRKVAMSRLKDSLTQYGSGWAITGNSSTDPSSNFIGTIDAKDLVFKTNGTERIRVAANGNIGIGVLVPNAPLQFPKTAGRKIVLHSSLGTGSDDHLYFGFGIESGTLVHQISNTGDQFLWRAGTNSTTSNTLMTLTGTGLLGIGTNPTNTLDVNGSVRIRGALTTATNNVLTVDANGVISSLGYTPYNGSTNPNNYITSSASITGNAATATKLATARTINISGGDAATGTAQSFDGSVNISLPLTLANSGVTANTYNTVTVNAKGLVTGGSNSVVSSQWTTNGSSISYSTGNVGIGTAGPNAPLQFADVVGRKITLHSGSVGTNNHQYFGLGIESATLINQVPDNGNVFVWRAGTSTTTSNTLMTLTGGGNLGIGTTSPQAPLHTSRILVNSTGGSFIGNLWDGTASVEGTEINGHAIYNQRSNATNLSLSKATGYTGIKYQDFGFNGSIIGSIAINGTSNGVVYNTTSDIRLKENIVSTSHGLNDVMRINVCDYNFKTDSSKALSSGFLAQELYKIYPQAVTVGGEDAQKNPWQVDYSKLVPILTKAIQEQQQQIEELKKKVDSMGARLQGL